MKLPRDFRLRRWTAAALMTGCAFYGLSASPGWAGPMFNGYIQHQEETPPSNATVTGLVTDEGGRPIAGARITIPDLALSTTTDATGRFTFPPGPNGRDMRNKIIGVAKAGYTPASGILDERTLLKGAASASGTNMKFKLQAKNRVVVLDQYLRHLGDNTYSARSANAGHFRKAAEGPSIDIPFTLEDLGGETLRRPPTLTIGAIIGLDTAEAHQMGQSFANVTSTPLEITLNGVPIGKLSMNGVGHKLPVPVQLLDADGVNVLRISAGYHRIDARHADFDDMELMTVYLEL